MFFLLFFVLHEFSDLYPGSMCLHLGHGGALDLVFLFFFLTFPHFSFLFLSLCLVLFCLVGRGPLIP